MSGLALIGAQWGDEGKGKITDYLGQKADMVVRYQGGDNAGHTITVGNQTYKLHLIPSGILFADTLSVIGNGVAINPKSLVNELTYLRNQGVQTDHLRISDRAHVIMPYHLKLDALQEESKGVNKVGTTQKGIGPAYMDKISRIGIRISDLLDLDTFFEKLRQNLTEKNQIFTKIYGANEMSFEAIFNEYYEYGRQIKQYVADTAVIVNGALESGQNVLFEGAQGVMLDIDHGTYPYVTSSNPISGGAAVGSGTAGRNIQAAIGICKAYTTRVGDGPFPTEVFSDLAETIRDRGREYGTVTKRPRRIGWFDAVVMNHARRVGGLTTLSLNLLDVLSGMATIKICTGYRLNGEVIDYVPASLKDLAKAEAIYEEMPGWQEDLSQVKAFSQLPVHAQNFVNKIEELTQLPIAMISVGPDRTQTIIRQDVWGKQ